MRCRRAPANCSTAAPSAVALVRSRRSAGGVFQRTRAAAATRHPRPLHPPPPSGHFAAAEHAPPKRATPATHCGGGRIPRRPCPHGARVEESGAHARRAACHWPGQAARAGPLRGPGRPVCARAAHPARFRPIRTKDMQKKISKKNMNLTVCRSQRNTV